MSYEGSREGIFVLKVISRMICSEYQKELFVQLNKVNINGLRKHLDIYVPLVTKGLKCRLKPQCIHPFS